MAGAGLLDKAPDHCRHASQSLASSSTTPTFSGKNKRRQKISPRRCFSVVATMLLRPLYLFLVRIGIINSTAQPSAMLLLAPFQAALDDEVISIYNT
jgi:hypothetical protein